MLATTNHSRLAVSQLEGLVYALAYLGRGWDNTVYDAHILCGLAKKAVEFFQRYPSEPFFAYIN